MPDLQDRMAELDDELASLLGNVPRQASADVIPWASRIITVKARWDLLRALHGEHVREHPAQL